MRGGNADEADDQIGRKKAAYARNDSEHIAACVAVLRR